jgi:hypothetical protein
MESLPLAGLLGLLLQAALATALVRFWLRQGESFYLLNVGNVSGVVYVVELVAWVVGFMLLILGRVRAALQLVVAAAVLTLVLLALDMAFSGDNPSTRSSLGGCHARSADPVTHRAGSRARDIHPYRQPLGDVRAGHLSVIRTRP